jgi:hypothetical protein
METGQGYWKNFAVAPLRVGYKRFQVKPELQQK